MTRALFQRWLGDQAERKPSEVADEMRKERAMADQVQPYTAQVVFDPVSWVSLWAREPGLRPPELTRDGGYFGKDWSLASFTAKTCGHGDSAKESVPQSVAAALCRDAGVRWLSHEWAIHICGPKVFVNWTNKPEIPESGAFFDDVDYARFSKGTLGESLWAACKAVLDARDAAKAGKPA